MLQIKKALDQNYAVWATSNSFCWGGDRPHGIMEFAIAQENKEEPYKCPIACVGGKPFVKDKKKNKSDRRLIATHCFCIVGYAEVKTNYSTDMTLLKGLHGLYGGGVGDWSGYDLILKCKNSYGDELGKYWRVFIFIKFFCC